MLAVSACLTMYMSDKIKLGYVSNEKNRKRWEQYLSNPENIKSAVHIICNPEKINEECVIVTPDMYKPDFKFKDYLKTHKVVKLQTSSSAP